MDFMNDRMVWIILRKMHFCLNTYSKRKHVIWTNDTTKIVRLAHS